MSGSFQIFVLAAVATSLGSSKKLYNRLQAFTLAFSQASAFLHLSFCIFLPSGAAQLLNPLANSCQLGPARNRAKSTGHVDHVESARKFSDIKTALQRAGLDAKKNAPENTTNVMMAHNLADK
jgi:hypothetical protein